MTIINIQDGVCWCCGNNNGNTVHHGIPQRMRPKQNVLIPLCVRCHKKLHTNDVSGIYSYAFKIERLTEQVNTGMKQIMKSINIIKNNEKNKKVFGESK